MTVEEKISHIREGAMEEARARGNEIIDQHQKALESVFKTHKQEAVMQADTRIKTETASLTAVKYSNIQRTVKT